MTFPELLLFRYSFESHNMCAMEKKKKVAKLMEGQAWYFISQNLRNFDYKMHHFFYGLLRKKKHC